MSNDVMGSTGGRATVLKRAFIIAWGCCTVFYFLEYAVRSAPAVMVPELATLFGVSVLGVSSIVGTYYYTYATTSLIAGVLLDHFGAKYVIAGWGVCFSPCRIRSWGMPAGCFRARAPRLPLPVRCILPRMDSRRSVWQRPWALRNASACWVGPQGNSLPDR